MAEEKKQDIAEEKTQTRKNIDNDENKKEAKQKSKPRTMHGAKIKNKKKTKFTKARNENKDEYEQRILDIARVTRVMAGGKRMRFRACVVVGNKKGKVGIGMGKGTDVTVAINKAVNVAKKNLIDVSIVNDTIPHEVRHKLGASKILLKPARKGRGVIAGGVVRVVLELAGVKNITSKIMGTNNKVNNAKGVISALKLLRGVNKHKNNTNKNK